MGVSKGMAGVDISETDGVDVSETAGPVVTVGVTVDKTSPTCKSYVQ